MWLKFFIEVWILQDLVYLQILVVSILRIRELFVADQSDDEKNNAKSWEPPDSVEVRSDLSSVQHIERARDIRL